MKNVILLSFCVLLSVFLFSCSTNDKLSIQTNTSDGAMRYRVKRAGGVVELNNEWDGGQWKRANVLELANYMGDRPAHFPKTQAKLLYDDNNLYVFFKVNDQYVRAVADQTHGKVWEDSCVEFFFMPDIALEDVYFNLETNCGGTMFFRYNDKQNKTEKYVESADCQKVEIRHSLPKIIADEITEPTTWTLSYKLPFEVISKYGKMTHPRSGAIWRANFYKIANMTSHRHWLTWSFIDHPTPKFHLPQYFGVLEFE